MAESVLHLPRRAARRFRDLNPAERLGPTLAAVLLLSGGLMAGALFYQHVVGLAPCKLCLIQRTPHYIALALAFAGLGLGAAGLAPRLLADLRAGLLTAAGIALAVTAGYGVYHTGAERKWWPGPADCTGTGMPNSMESFNTLLVQGERFVRCDEVPWSFLGLSMASYNAIVSLIGAVFVLFIVAGYLRTRMSSSHGAPQHG